MSSFSEPRGNTGAEGSNKPLSLRGSQSPRRTRGVKSFCCRELSQRLWHTTFTLTQSANQGEFPDSGLIYGTVSGKASLSSVVLGQVPVQGTRQAVQTPPWYYLMLLTGSTVTFHEEYPEIEASVECYGL